MPFDAPSNITDDFPDRAIAFRASILPFHRHRSNRRCHRNIKRGGSAR